MAELSPAPQPQLTWFSKGVARISTFFKRRGVSGWRETYCIASATGVLYYDAAHSTDGFWTLDLELEDFAIGAEHYTGERPRYLRIEVEPHTKAHDLVGDRPLRKGDRVQASGVLVVDTDANFLEIHPDTGFRLIQP